jgi:hypothetical protein
LYDHVRNACVLADKCATQLSYMHSHPVNRSFTPCTSLPLYEPNPMTTTLQNIRQLLLSALTSSM